MQLVFILGRAMGIGHTSATPEKQLRNQVCGCLFSCGMPQAFLTHDLRRVFNAIILQNIKLRTSRSLIFGASYGN